MIRRLSITFDNVNTWEDWGLISSGRPVFSLPTLKPKYVDVPGTDGQLDLTEVFTGSKFGNRTGSFTFIISERTLPWEELYHAIQSHLHGKEIRAVLADDPEWYYEGRFTLNQFKSSEAFGVVVIDYTCQSVKQEILYANEDWLWDSFDFNNHTVADHFNLEVDGSRDITIYTSSSSTPFIFTTTSPMAVLYKGTSYPLPKGTTEVKEITRDSVPVNFIVYGDGLITINYRGRSM